MNHSIGTAFKALGSAADGAQSQICHDVLGRETRTRAIGFDGQWLNADTHYDYASRPVAVSEPSFGAANHWSYTDFDEIGRVLQVTHPDDSTESWTYASLTTTHINARGQAHTVKTNVLGEKIEETTADGGVTTYRYDALGQLVWTDGPLNGTTDRVTIEYDLLGNKRQMSDPDQGTWQYRYNALGELVCQQDAEGQGSRLSYDELGRLTQRDDLSDVTDLEACAGTVAGSSSWTFGNVAGTTEFGQALTESADYEGDQTDRDYDYDTLGRVSSVTTVITGADEFEREYEERTTYDQFGRVFQQFDASGDDRGVRNLYSSFGYLEAIREAREGAQGLVYWQVLAHDERGNVTEALLGNGITARASHDPATGRLLNLWTEGDPGMVSAQHLEMIWDELGNLKARHDDSRPAATLSEQFFYDDCNRLEQVDRCTGTEECQTAQTLTYDLAGNITQKSDVGNYTYGNNAGPHAVTQAGDRSFQYDANGNVISDSEVGGQARQYSYTTFNKVSSLTSEGKTTEFHYAASRGRTLKRELEGTSVTARTHYVGGLEIVWDGQSPDENSGKYRRYIGGVALVTFHQATETSDIRYQHKDHLGSITAITDEAGEIVARMAFDPWGQRRDPEDLTQPWQQWINPIAPAWAEPMLAITPRGYTGHEHLDVHGIVHMNGRIYDPHLGRFLQADPFVEDATTLNRYTYVHNNPLSYSDPSGYFSFKKAFKKGFWHSNHGLALRSIDVTSKVVANNPFLDTVGMAAACYWGGYLGCAGASALGTHYRGGDLGDSIRAGVISGVTAAAFSGASYGIDSLGASATTTFTLKVVANGVIGGVSAELQGGKFGHGFASAGLTAAASPAIQRAPGGMAGETAAAAIVGGTASSITGGKFANGAVTGAMSYGFGEMARRRDSQVPEFELDTTEGRQQAADWIWENRTRFDIEAPDGTGFEYVDEYMMLTHVGRVACDGPCQNIDNVRTFEMAGEYFDRQNLVRLYRGAFNPLQSAVIQPPGGNPTIIGGLNMSPTGAAVWSLGHEAAHARGIEVGTAIYPHLRSEYHGYQAFQRYRALRGN